MNELLAALEELLNVLMEPETPEVSERSRVAQARVRKALDSMGVEQIESRTKETTPAPEILRILPPLPPSVAPEEAIDRFIRFMS